MELIEGGAEDLPVDSDWADLVISNGVLNLATCKGSAFAEVARVLEPGGWLQTADLMLVEDLSQDLENDEFAWSNCSVPLSVMLDQWAVAPLPSWRRTRSWASNWRLWRN